jgi:hypothetical protein
MPFRQSVSSIAVRVISAISPASKGAAKQAKTRARRAAMRPSGVAAGASRMVLIARGTQLLHRVDQRKVVLDRGVGAGQRHVEGRAAQAA